MVQQSGVAFIQDRLGSNGKYFPYGEERNYPALPNDQVKFATYTRDSATGLDYADQRYYTWALGRFVTSDPYTGSVEPNSPQSWNRYSYVANDPINANDTTGLCDVIFGGLTMKPWDSQGLEDFATLTNSITAFSYSNNDAGVAGFIAGMGQVVQQAYSDLPPSTRVGVDAIVAASLDPGPINATTYSAGAQTFTAADAWLQKYAPQIASRIQNVTYLSPGSFGPTLASGSGQTTIIYGEGPAEELISLLNIVPPGAEVLPEKLQTWGR